MNDIAPAPAATEHNDATRRLARHVATTGFGDLNERAVHSFKRALLDYLATSITGSQEPVSRQMLEYLASVDDSRTAAVIGSAQRLSVLNAALLNGTSTHALDFDDGHTNASAHPAGPNFPAVFAVAEQKGLDAKRVILATVMGYDVMLRVSSAIHPASALRGWHNTPITGVLGAAAGVSKLIDNDEEQTLFAIGLAGSFAGGLFEFLGEGADIKRIHPGKAARDGVLCAELGKRRITGPSHVLEGKHGFFKAFVDNNVNWERLFQDLGSRYEIEDAYFKPYPCCRHLHPIMDGIVTLKKKHHVNPAQVERIEAGSYSVGARHNHTSWEALLDAQMSMPCAAALALIEDDVTSPSFKPGRIDRPEVQAMIQKVKVYTDAETDRVYPKRRGGVVTLVMKDGARLTERVLDPKGEGENPMSDADLDRKFLSNCEPIIGKDKCQRLLEAVWGFDRLDSLAAFYRW
ncbi:MAG: MmgE/PrpD family protein [Betaproteobacteria bacterium]|nr:MAG: MmgE/PrpD family protein [Betaproteobacteria bacterium]